MRAPGGPSDLDPVRAPRSVARQGHLREHNLAVALAHVVDAPTPPSRADIAAATGLARATVSGLVDQLIAARLVRETDPVLARRAGRPAVPLVPAAGTVAGIGAEVNVDYLGVRAVDLAGGVLAERLEAGDLRGSDPARVLGRLARMTAEVVTRLRQQGVHVAGTALALPGLVDRVTGPLRVAPNLGWRDVDVVSLVTHPQTAGLGVRVANEAKLAARAEAHARRGDHRPSFWYVSGEVGIGGALVLDGEIFTGRHGWSGEIGHLVVDPARPGAEGTLERLAGQDALLASAGLAGRGMAELVRAVAAGDTAARAAVTDGARALGLALANVVNVVDVEEVVLGGTFAGLFDAVRTEVAEALEARVIFAPWSLPRVSRARAGDLPAMTGGALAVLRGVVAAPLAVLPVLPGG